MRISVKFCPIAIVPKKGEFSRLGADRTLEFDEKRADVAALKFSQAIQPLIKEEDGIILFEMSAVRGPDDLIRIHDFKNLFVLCLWNWHDYRHVQLGLDF